MTDEKQPCWLYRLGKDNKAEAVLFPDGAPDDMNGLYDHPDKVKRRGRPPKAEAEPEDAPEPDSE